MNSIFHLNLDLAFLIVIIIIQLRMRHKNLDNKKNLHTQEDTTTVYSGKVYTKAGKTFDIKKYLKHTLS